VSETASPAAPRPKTASTDAASISITPDNFKIRLLVCAAAAGLAVGCGLDAASASLGAQNFAQWLILVSLCAGVALALIHLLEILTRHLQTRLSELLGLLAVYATTLVLVSYTQIFFGHSSAGAPPRSMYIIPFSAALLVLLLRATVQARCAAPFLPLGFSRTIVIKRNRGVLLSEELCVPARRIYALYWLSPLAWWGLAYSLLMVRKLTLTSPLLIALLVVVSCALVARVLLGIAVYLAAFKRHREAKAAGDEEHARETRWYLGFNGLTAGGIVAFFAFSLMCLRLQDEALATSMRAQDSNVVAQLREMQPGPIEAAENAEPHYANALLALPPAASEIFRERWNTPEAALYLRKSSRALDELKLAAAIERDQVEPDYGSDNMIKKVNPRFDDRRMLIWTLILEARFAAEDGNWKRVLADTQSALKSAQHCRAQPFLNAWEEGNFTEHYALMGLLASTVWTENTPADDATLVEAQKLIREFADRRANTLIPVTRIACLLSLRCFHAKLSQDSQTWPGDVSPAALIECRPLMRWIAQRQLWEFSETVLPDFQSGFIEVERDELVTRSNAFGDCYHLSTLPTQMQRLTKLELETLCDYRFADVALALARYKLKNQYWPKTLQECVPEFLPYLSKDPFKPHETIRYATNPPRLYSLGDAFEYKPANHGAYPWSGPLLVSDTITRTNLLLFLGKPPKNDPVIQVLPGAELDGDVAALKSFNASDRRDALHRLALIGTKAAPAAEALIPLLSDPDVEQRLYAAYILGRIGPAASVALDALRAAQWTDDADVRVFVKQALRALK
jgi:hypothetical protein